MQSLNKKRIAAIVLCLILIFVCSATASAANLTVTYDGNAKKFVFVPQSTDLFWNFKGVMPGDTLTQDITVKNDTSNGVKVKIYLRAESTEEQYKEFLSQMTLTVMQEGNSVLFSAPANEQDGITNNVYLGTFYSGAQVNLKVTLNVPISMENKYQNGIGVINWVFTVEELPIESTDPSPKTGDTSNVIMYGSIAIASAAGLLLLLLFKRKNKVRIYNTSSKKILRHF